MNKIATLTAGCLVFLFATSAGARERKIDFDQGVNASDILREAREKAATQLTPMPRIDKPLHTLKRKKTKSLPYPLLAPAVSNSAVYQSAANLRTDPKYQALDPQALQPLEQTWGQINNVRSGLLSRASDWDGRDQQLGNDSDALDQRRAQLVQRQASLNTEIAQFNQQCTGRPLPPDQYQQCLSWQQSLQQEINQFDADRQQFNADVDAWNQRSQAIFQDHNTLVGQIQAWENQINGWIEAAKKAIEAECRPLDKLNIPGTSPISLTTTDPPEPFEAQTIFKSEPAGAPPCPVDLSWFLSAIPSLPNVSMGGLSATSGKTTSFKPGPGAGTATLVVAEKTAGKGSNTIDIIVFNPAATSSPKR